MNDYRTPHERELHDIIVDAISAFGNGKLGREAFRDVMGRLRNARVLLDNKKFGCASGRHAGACECKEAA